MSGTLNHMGKTLYCQKLHPEKPIQQLDGSCAICGQFGPCRFNTDGSMIETTKIKRVGPIGLVDGKVFIRLLDGSSIQLTCIAGPYGELACDAITTALKLERESALREAAKVASDQDGKGGGYGDYISGYDSACSRIEDKILELLGK